MRHITFGGFRRIRGIKRYFENSRKKAAIFSVGITFLVFLWISLTFEPLLGPDDVGYRNLLSGLYTGAPEAHVYFIRYLLAKFLALLYTWVPGVYWYVLFLTLANYGCLILVLYRFIRRIKKHRLSIAVVVAVVFSLSWMTFFITLEWTTTAGILSATAIFWYATIPIPADRKLAFREYLPSLVLLFIAFNLRTDSAKMAIPFAGIVFLLKLMQGKSYLNKEFLHTQFTFMFLCVAVMGISFLAHKIAYSSDEWKEADTFSDYRSTMFDRYGWPDYESYQEVYNENNISYEMYQSIKSDYNLILAYKGILSSSNFEELSKIAQRDFNARKSSLLQRIKDCISKRINAVKSKEYQFHSILIYIGMLTAIYCGLRRMDLARVLLCVITIIGYESIWIWLYLGNRLPIHVAYSLNIIAIATEISFLWTEPQLFQIIRTKVALFAVALIILWGITTRIPMIQQRNSTEAMNALLLSETKIYCEEHKSNIYFRDFYSYNNSILYKERIYDRDERKAANFLPPNGWSVILPFDNQFVPSGGHQELCSWIQTKDNIYILLEESRAEGICKRIEALFASRGIKCHLELEDTIHISNGKTVVEVYHYQCVK